MEKGEIKQTNSNDCLVCYSQKGINKLCNKCKYLYCQECSVRLENRCSICLRNTDSQSNTHLYFPYQEFIVPLNFIPFSSSSNSLADSLTDNYVYPSTENEWQRFFRNNFGYYGWNYDSWDSSENMIRIDSEYLQDGSGNSNIRFVIQEDDDEYDFEQLSRMYYWW